MILAWLCDECTELMDVAGYNVIQVPAPVGKDGKEQKPKSCGHCEKQRNFTKYYRIEKK